MRNKKEKNALFSDDARLAARPKDKPVIAELEQNSELIKTELEDVNLIQYRNLSVTINRRPKKLCFIFTVGVVNPEIIDGFIIKPLMTSSLVDKSGDCIQFLMEPVIQVNGIKRGVICLIS